MKTYFVLFRDLDTNIKTVVMATYDENKAYGFRAKTPRNKELIIEVDGKEVFKMIKV